MGGRLRDLTLGVLGGVGAGALVLAVAALMGGLAAATGAIASSSVLLPTRVAAVLTAGAVAGAIAGGIASSVRSPGGAALLGATAAVAASGVIGALDPNAMSWGANPPPLGERLVLLLLAGAPGLGAPALWAPVRAAAARAIPRAALEIAGRVGAYVLALGAALLCAPFLLRAMYGVAGGLRALPRMDVLMEGLSYGGLTVVSGAVSMLCLRLAGVPRDRGTLPGFEQHRSRRV